MTTYLITTPDGRESVCTRKTNRGEFLTKVPVEWIKLRYTYLWALTIWLVAKYGKDNVEIKEML